jgi:hypothetical protein
MNKVFDPGRFSKLFIKHTAEHYKSYLMSLTVLIGVMVLGASFIVYILNAPIDVGFQSGLFMSIMLLSGTIFASNIFSDYGDRKKATAALMLPASHFEKYLVAWLYSFVIFLVLFTVSFYLVDWFAINIKHYPGQEAVMINVFTMPVAQFFVLYAFLHAVALWGAIYYEKLHFIKTGFLFFILLAILTGINKFIMGALLNTTVLASPPFSGARILEHTREISFNVTGNEGGFMLILLTVLALFFWASAYFRLKEKQV